MPVIAAVHVEDQDRSGAETPLAAAADGYHVVSGDNLRLRAGTNLLALQYWWAEQTAGGGDFIRGRLISPSIRTNPLRFHRGFSLFDEESHPDLVYDYRDNPLALIRAGEDLSAEIVETDEAGVAHCGASVGFYCSGPIARGGTAPLTHQVRATVGSNTTALVWTQQALTLEDSLPAGIYRMFGASVQSATAICAAFIFQRKDINGGLPRPVIVKRAEEGMHHPYNSNWGLPAASGGAESGGHFVVPDGLPDLYILTQLAETISHVELYLQKVG